MKKILLFILIVISIQSFGQTPTGYQSRLVREKVISFMVDSTLHIPSYCGTPSGVRSGGSIRDGALAIDTCNNILYIYSSNIWSQVSGNNFANFNLTQTAARTYAGAGFNYTLNNLGHWTFNMANDKDFLINNALGFYASLSESNWAINGSGGADNGNWIEGNSLPFPNSVDIHSGYSSTRKTDIHLLPDSLVFEPGGNGTIHIDSVRTGTGDDEVLTWNAGMVRKMPTVKYNFTDLHDGDIIIYDSVNNEWINSAPTISGGGTDSSFYLKEYPDVSYLDTSSYNAAIIDGRLWIKYGDDWRRQAYDSTYTPSVPPAVYFTEDFTGTNGDAVTGRTTTTGSLTWAISGGTTIGQRIESNADQAATKNAALSRYYVDPGHHDIDLRGTISAIQASSPLMFLMLAFTDDNNFIQVNMVTGEIDQTLGGSYSMLQAGSGTSVVTDIIRCNLNGNTLSVYRNGSLLHSVSISGSLTGTKCGIYYYDDGGLTGSAITFIEGREAE